LTDKLRAYGVPCALLSGEVPQEKRIRVLEDFRAGRLKVVVATDVAGARPAVEGISHVINYNLPQDAEDYVPPHRPAPDGPARPALRQFCLRGRRILHSDIERYIGERSNASIRRKNCCNRPHPLLTRIRPPARTSPIPAAGGGGPIVRRADIENIPDYTPSGRPRTPAAYPQARASGNRLFEHKHELAERVQARSEINCAGACLSALVPTIKPCD
jgi:hypothetical protein